MAALHEALKCLNPTTWDSVPTTADEMRAYVNDISTKARLIVDSVPEPPSPNGHHHHNSHGSESSSPSSRMRPSTARLITTDEATRTLQNEWGKPIKINSVKDNPLDIPVYKLPGIDGNGHWFSRRSVHEGLPFAEWQKKLSSEMMETLRMNQERVREGKLPDQSVRGIGAEKQIEEVEVFADSGSASANIDVSGGGKKKLGSVNVLHVSAQFPKPTTPRDFVTMIINWETGVSGAGGGGGRTGRNWMMVSRPCQHPDVPPNQGFIRGQYESVEFIREIPIKEKTGVFGSGDGDGSDEDAWNPVEWIMITRSDPGGNIPRWMVEKGTPRSICMDAVKFLDWACQDMPRRQANGHLRKSSGKSESSGPTTGPDDMSGGEDSDTDVTEPELEPQEHHGLIASCVYLLNAGLERYAPQPVLDFIPRHLRYPFKASSKGEGEEEEEEEDTSFDTRAPPKSVPGERSFAGESGKDLDNGETHSLASTNSGHNTPTDINTDISPADIIRNNQKGKLSSHEKQLAKLAQQKRSIESQLELVQNDIHSLRLRPSEEEVKSERAAALSSVDSPATDRASSSAASSVKGQPSSASHSSSHPKQPGTNTKEAARMNKVASGLFHEESKLIRQLSKIEKQQTKEAAKLEAHQRKKAEQKEKTRSHTEKEYLRQEIESLKKELEKLKGERRKWLDLVGSLQTENKKLAKAVSEANAK